jgi:hypothetical protein
VERPEDIVGSTLVFVQVWFVWGSVTTCFEMPWTLERPEDIVGSTFVFVQVWFVSGSVTTTWFEMPWNGRVNLSFCSGVVRVGFGYHLV